MNIKLVALSHEYKNQLIEMIRLALQECQKLGLDRVLITCHRDNIGSVKSIVKNGGMLENEVLEDGKILQRYWIDLK